MEPFDRNIGPHEEMKYTHRFIPRKSGQHRLVGIFSSDQLIDINGSVSVEVL